MPCPICYLDWSRRPDEAPIVLGCGHSLCSKCRGRIERCPVCRAPIENERVNYALCDYALARDEEEALEAGIYEVVDPRGVALRRRPPGRGGGAAASSDDDDDDDGDDGGPGLDLGDGVAVVAVVRGWARTSRDCGWIRTRRRGEAVLERRGPLVDGADAAEAKILALGRERSELAADEGRIRARRAALAREEAAHVETRDAAARARRAAAERLIAEARVDRVGLRRDRSLPDLFDDDDQTPAEEGSWVAEEGSLTSGTAGDMAGDVRALLDTSNLRLLRAKRAYAHAALEEALRAEDAPAHAATVAASFAGAWPPAGPGNLDA